MRRQGRRNIGCHSNVWRNRLSIAGAFIVRSAPVHLEVWVGLLAIQYLAGASRGHTGINRQSILRRRLMLLLLLLLGDQMGLCLGGCEVSLAVLEMLNLARRVLCAHEAAM